MDENQFSAFLGVMIPEIIRLIVDVDGLSETEAIDRFYSSEISARLADEHLKLWHFSPQTLFSLYRQEQETGRIVYPEEAG